MNHLYPLKLSYVTKSPLWGGTRLLDDWGISAPVGQSTVGEAWMLTVRDKDMSVIQNGALAGMTMREYIGTYGNGVVGASFTGGDFPLLIKLIDACDKLSVQVHPDDTYAARVENDRGKTEMWIIVEADEDAEIIYGLKDGISAEQFCTAVREGRLAETMHHCPVKAGEVYFIPSGMLHAIGKGILIAEIQQNADLTYRVYDFDRLGPDGKLRQLHVEKALDVTRSYTEEEINAIRYACGSSCESGELLANSVYFSARKLCVKASDEGQKITATKDSFVSVLCIGGEGEISFGGEKYPVSIGDSYLLPAGMGACMLWGDVTVILSEV